MGSRIKTLQSIEIQPRHFDLLVLLALLVVSPLHWLPLRLSLPPDSIAYLSFAETSLDKGLLYLSGWGHVDSAVILPPLYPVLIALLGAVSKDAIGNAVAISYACSLLLTVPIYLYARRFAPSLVAAIAVLLTQFSFSYVLFDGPVTTEALFVFVLATTLFLAMHLTMHPAPRAWHGMALGALAALAFFARQIGLVAGAFLLLWFLLDAMRYRSGPWMQRLRLPICFGVGWAVPLAMYSALLYGQSGQVGLKQTFRLGSYVVKTADPAVMERIDELNRLDGPAHYKATYAKRRKLRELLPDASEMLSDVVQLRGAAAKAGDPGFKIDRTVRKVFRNIHRNLRHFLSQFGLPTLVLGALAFVSPLVLRSGASPMWPRLLLPGFVVSYLVALSFLTSGVARYVTVLFPFVIMQVAVELGVLHALARTRSGSPLVTGGFIAIAFALLLLAERPVQRFNKRAFPDYTDVFNRQAVIPGEPTFALVPVFSFLAGGSFRTMPNDSLEKVVHYARLTGVRWILVPQHDDLFGDISLYNNAAWLHTPGDLLEQRGLLRYCCVVEHHLLFEIVSSGP